MRTLGIVGGIGPDSTIEYYKLIVAACRERGEDARVVINSVSVKKVLALAAASPDELTAYLLEAIENLARAGADLGLLAANTPHVVFDATQQSSPIPIVSIVEAACVAVKSQGVARAGLFGTRVTMQARFYPEAFAKEGITIVVPQEAEQAYIHEKYTNELVAGRFDPGTRDGMLRIVDRMIADERIESLVLAGTELPLLLRDPGGRPLSLVDTTRAHVDLAMKRALA